jgi:hypothetical protein
VTQTPFTLTRCAPIATGIGIEIVKIRKPRKVVITGLQKKTRTAMTAMFLVLSLKSVHGTKVRKKTTIS